MRVGLSGVGGGVFEEREELFVDMLQAKQVSSA